ncbi:hypothetical protein, partial [Pseudomonas faucium]|uniref:hypothetical protein n=1 Tax=Pseudomonas faucium TaxID=2740518 RepID=UPI0015967064
MSDKTLIVEGLNVAFEGRSGSSDTSASCSTKPMSLPRTARHWRSLRPSRSWPSKQSLRAVTCARCAVGLAG